MFGLGLSPAPELTCSTQKEQAAAHAVRKLERCQTRAVLRVARMVVASLTSPAASTILVAALARGAAQVHQVSMQSMSSY